MSRTGPTETRPETSGTDEAASLVAEAARPFAPLWPLRAFVAVDPLVDLAGEPFADALAEAARWLPLDARTIGAAVTEAWRDGRLDAADLEASLEALASAPWPEEPPEPVSLAASEAVLAAIDREVAKVCTAFVGGVLGAGEGTTLFAAWRALVGQDPGARRLLGSAGRRRLAATCPADPGAALLGALERLGVPDADRARFLTAHLARLPGWAAYAKWWSEQSPGVATGPRVDLVELAALRVSYVAAAADAGRDGVPYALAGRAGLPRLPPLPDLPERIRTALAELPPALGLEALLGALERASDRRLLGTLRRPSKATAARAVPAAQVLCCIDAREARLREELEATGRYETEGVAGFFGVPIDVQAGPVGGARSLRPPLVPPAATLHEDGATPPSPLDRLASDGKGAANASIGGGFALVEAAGVVAALRLLVSTGGPRLLGRFARPSARHRSARDHWPAAECWPEVDDDLAAALLASLLAPTGIGSARSAAPLVVLLGHTSSSVNNLYASSLHCGACGAEPGGTNAVATARLANRPGVRARLARAGVVLDEGTWFVAAEHDTTTGEVRLLDTASLPASHRRGADRLAEDLSQAGRAALERSAPRLPGLVAGRSPARLLADEPARRAVDPSELQPELGLAGVAALVVGPRHLVAGRDLEGRAFLHSYDQRLDPDGSVLAQILSGPVVVAQWITGQYLGAVLFPGAFGGADKVALNALGDQVALPAGSLDPATGLPRQSVQSIEGRLHEPLRLLVAVAASHERVDQALEQAPAAAELVRGRHLRVVSVDPVTGRCGERRSNGGWHAVCALAQPEDDGSRLPRRG